MGSKMGKIKDLFNIFKNTSVVGMFVYQKDGKVVLANDATAKIFGFKKENDILGKSFLDFIASQKEEILKAVKLRTETKEKALEPKEPREYKEIKIKRTDGSTLWVDSFTYSITFDGKPSGLAILIDKTKEKNPFKHTKSFGKNKRKPYRSFERKRYGWHTFKDL